MENHTTNWLALNMDSIEAQNRKQSLDDINLDQFLKIANYEDTVKELDIYYGIGEYCERLWNFFDWL